MKVGRDYSWWVDYSYSYDLFMEDEQTWKNCVDFDADRFNCPKKDLQLLSHTNKSTNYSKLEYR